MSIADKILDRAVALGATAIVIVTTAGYLKDGAIELIRSMDSESARLAASKNNVCIDTEVSGGTCIHPAQTLTYEGNHRVCRCPRATTAPSASVPTPEVGP